MSLPDDLALVDLNPWIPGTPAREIARQLNVDRRRAAYLKGLAEARAPRPEAPLVDRPPRIGVVGDAHFSPDQSNERAHILGRWIVDNLDGRYGDTLVTMGDWWGMDSLCKHAKPSEIEGKRVKADLAAGHQALDIVDSYVATMAHPPRKVNLLGNHEDRAEKLAADLPALQGFLGAHCFKHEGWELVPFKEHLEVYGVQFVHYLSNAMGRAYSSEKDPARYVLEKHHYSSSIVVGHNHVMDLSTIAELGQGRKHGLCVGWYGDFEEYAGDRRNAAWWKGLFLLHDVVDGDFDAEPWSWSRLVRTYGG